MNIERRSEFPRETELPAWASRPDVITIEGLAATGTTSLSEQFCADYGYGYVSASAIARGLAAAYETGAGSLDDLLAIERFYQAADVEVAIDGMRSQITVNGHDVTDRLFIPETDQAAAHLMRYEAVPARVSRDVRRIVSRGNAVIDGRLVAKTIAPDADLNVFLTADLETRIDRRYRQAVQEDSGITRASIAADLIRRDANESRAGADQAPEGAIILDTSGLSVPGMAATVVAEHNRRCSDY
jgi:cytidylate kinase